MKYKILFVFLAVAVLWSCWNIDIEDIKVETEDDESSAETNVGIPTVPPASALCLSVPLRYGDSPGWVDAGRINRVGDLGLFIWHWNLSGSEGHQALEVWKINDPGIDPTLEWYDYWFDPQLHLSLPNIPWGPGPGCVGNFKGGDGYVCEVVYRRIDDGDAFLRMVWGPDGTSIKQIRLPGKITPYHTTLHEIHAANFLEPRDDRYSDLVLSYLSPESATVIKVEAYHANSLVKRWQYYATEGQTIDGRHNPRWSLENTPFVLRKWANGYDAFYGGLWILDRNGGGSLGDSRCKGPQIELIGEGRNENFNVRSWKSMCEFSDGDPGTNSYPVIFATTGEKFWRFPGLSMFCKNANQCYWEYLSNKEIPTLGNARRFRRLDNDHFMYSDTDRILVVNRHNLKVVGRISNPGRFGAERIQWDGEGPYEILTHKGIYNLNGNPIHEKPPYDDNLGNHVVFDIDKDGCEEYGVGKKINGKWVLQFYQNTSVKKKKRAAIIPDPNHGIY